MAAEILEAIRSPAVIDRSIITNPGLKTIAEAIDFDVTASLFDPVLKSQCLYPCLFLRINNRPTIFLLPVSQKKQTLDDQLNDIIRQSILNISHFRQGLH